MEKILRHDLNSLQKKLQAEIFDGDIKKIREDLKAQYLRIKDQLTGEEREVVDDLVHHHRRAIYTTIAIITMVSLYGMTKIKVIGFLVDDLPKKDPVYEHLHFFERNFHGVMPFEINVDTKKENGVFADRGHSAAATLYKIQALQRMMKKYDAFLF